MYTLSGIPDKTLGWDVLEWCTRHLGHPDGERMGDPWVFSPEQARFVLWFYALDDRGKFVYRRALMARSKGAGKALALDTPVPVPGGWSTMGDLLVGDTVYSGTGDPCRVLAKSPIWASSDCYRVSFTGGDSVVASGEHLWMFDDLYRGYSPRLLDTRELSETFLAGHGAKRYRFSPVGVEWAAGALPIDPYILRHVSSVERVPTVDTVCVEVDSPDHMFLVGESMIPTHNSPIIGTLCCVELLGPVRFSHWDTSGNPVGTPVPSPLVQLVAVSEAQTDNTFSLIREMLKLGDAEDAYGLEVGRSRVLSEHGRLEPVTANARSREGQRVSFSVFDETHLWVDGNRGRQLASVVRRNAAKMGARTIEATNAPAPGENSVAEDSYTLYSDIKDGRKKDTGVLFDIRQAPDDAPLAPGPGRRAALIEAYGDACAENGGWVDLDRIEMEIDDPATSPEDARRFYFNQLCKSSSQWLRPSMFALGARRAVVAKNEPIALGFDGSIRNDSTALVGCRLSDGFLWPIRVWENPGGEPGKTWEVPFLEVDQVVRETLTTFDVRWMYADPAYWQDVVGKWSADYPDTVYEFWTHRKAAMCSAIERFESAVARKELVYSDDPAHSVLPKHVGHAHVTVTPSGRLIRKEYPKSGNKIDAAMAAVLAYEARGSAIQDGRMNDDDDSDSMIFGF